MTINLLNRWLLRKEIDKGNKTLYFEEKKLNVSSQPYGRIKRHNLLESRTFRKA